MRTLVGCGSKWRGRILLARRGGRAKLTARKALQAASAATKKEPAGKWAGDAFGCMELRKRQAPQWTDDHELGSDESSAEEPPSPPRAPPKPKAASSRKAASSNAQAPAVIKLAINLNPARDSGKTAGPTKEERALEAKYEQLRAAIDSSRKVTTRVTKESKPAADHVAAAATFASSSSTIAPGSGERSLKRSSAKRIPGAQQLGMPAQLPSSLPLAHQFPGTTTQPQDRTAPHSFPSDFPPGFPPMHAEQQGQGPTDGGFDAMWE